MWFLLLTCAAAATCDDSSLLQQVPGLHIDLVVPPVPSQHEQPGVASMVKPSPEEKAAARAAEKMAAKAAQREQARRFPHEKCPLKRMFKDFKDAFRRL